MIGCAIAIVFKGVAVRINTAGRAADSAVDLNIVRSAMKICEAGVGPAGVGPGPVVFIVKVTLRTKTSAAA